MSLSMHEAFQTSCDGQVILRDFEVLPDTKVFSANEICSVLYIISSGELIVSLEETHVHGEVD